MRADQVRRTVLAAQGLARPRPTGRVDRRHLRRVVATLGLVQIDSVNVLERAHHVPFFSRLGPHDRSLLPRLAYDDHELFEYWGHEASLIDVELEPALRWRKAQTHRWKSLRRLAEQRPDLVDALEAEVHEHGPVSAGELGDGEAKRGPWWGWGDTKQALEYLFWTGRVAALRRDSFERTYCRPDLAIPAAILDRPTPPEDDAMRTLAEVAVRAHGVATATDVGDYWRVPARDVRPRLAELVEEGVVDEVAVEGWRTVAYRHRDAVVPRRVDACALVSPFDVAMWDRRRISRIHGFDYTIEIYVPAAQRVHGYYVLPFLLGDTFVARVDLKADRRDRRLLVQAAHVEDDLHRRGHRGGPVDVLEVADRLAGELRAVATWLELDDVVVADRGDLARAVAVALGR